MMHHHALDAVDDERSFAVISGMLRGTHLLFDFSGLFVDQLQ